MAYKAGDKCLNCGSIVTVRPCSICNGDGKSRGNWNRFTNVCPICFGTGEDICCEYSRTMTFSDYLSGKTCASIFLPSIKR